MVAMVGIKNTHQALTITISTIIIIMNLRTSAITTIQAIKALQATMNHPGLLTSMIMGRVQAIIRIIRPLMLIIQVDFLITTILLLQSIIHIIIMIN